MHSIMDGFRRVADFSGRDRPGRFWPFALVIVGLVFAGFSLSVIPAASAILAEASAYAAEHPESEKVVSGPGFYSVKIHDADAALMPDMAPVILVLRLWLAAAVLLLAGAVTRRLHDTGRAAWWGLPPVIFLAVGLATFPMVIEQTSSEQAPLGLFFLLFANNLLYLLSLVGLIILLSRGGSPSANRYGPPAV